jgi:hypothetical protein
MLSVEARLRVMRRRRSSEGELEKRLYIRVPPATSTRVRPVWPAHSLVPLSQRSSVRTIQDGLALRGRRTRSSRKWLRT